MKAARPSLFLVLRESLRLDDSLAPAAYRCRAGEGPQGDPVALFADRARAEAARLALEDEARGELSPFLFAWTDSYFTSLHFDELRASLAALGLEVPDIVITMDAHERGRRWREWWNGLIPEPTPDQRAAVWALCDTVVLYTVHEVPQEG